MIIKGKELEVVRSKRYEVEGIKCDICGIVIKPPSKNERYDWQKPEYKYYSVTTGHHDWGNDSSDSIQHRHICPDCIVDFVKEYLGISEALTIDKYPTKYIEIETEHLYFGTTIEAADYGRLE